MRRGVSTESAPLPRFSEGITRPVADETTRCPVSQTIGSNVGLITIKALLNGTALRRLDGKNYRFCPEPDCEVVYFDREAGSRFEKCDLVVRVGRKESEDPIPLCYCFDITAADLKKDLKANGRTDIPSMVAAEIKAGHCACEVKNPKGSCCLGDINGALRRLQARSSRAETPRP